MTQRYAHIIPLTNAAFGHGGIFSYEIPENMEIARGMVVKIPFGKKLISGMVRDVSDNLQAGEENFELKQIIGIAGESPLFTPQLFSLAEKLSDYYLCPPGAVFKMIAIKNAPRAKPAEPLSNEISGVPKIVLNPGQKIAVKKISDSLGKPETFLLYGVTGSGKTEVYLNAAKKVVEKGEQALFLVPEITLTPQTLSRLLARFPAGQVAVIHSKITYGQKYLIWKKISSGEIKILIGPRSALFAPFQKLGLIVIDEEHDSSYKQEQRPKYHAGRAAEFLSEIHGCPLILGDATPAVETYHSAENSLIEKLSLPERIFQKLPAVEIVDMREEVRRGNFSIFSERLIEEIKSNLELSRQIILFINRRGTATSYLCADCGNVFKCDRCSVPLVYHESSGSLVCHHCEKKYPLPALCPACKSHKLKFAGTGTEKVERLISANFPKARILRIDRDTAGTKTDLESIHASFARGNFDILVGTQLLAKGWDFPQVGLIGVVNSDTALNMPDFRTNERSFQLITQVAGRAGRKDFPGKAIFQTYNPDNFALQAAVSHDYDAFYRKELEFRKEFNYPPFGRLIKCSFKHSKIDYALGEGRKLAEEINGLNDPDIQILGPAPAFVSKIRNRHIVYVIIKISNREPAGVREIPLSLKNLLLKKSRPWDIDVDPESTL